MMYGWQRRDLESALFEAEVLFDNSGYTSVKRIRDLLRKVLGKDEE
jgi:hypothetical protein